MSNPNALTDQLRPCPFCGGGEYNLDKSKHWTGVRSIVLSVALRHWCERKPSELPSTITIKRKTEAEAIAAWNKRTHND